MTTPESENEKSLAARKADAPKALVTPLKTMERQVGEHVIASLQQPNTAAVLSTVMAGPDGSQHIVSVPLDQERLADVEAMLSDANEGQRVPCIGFQCFLPRPEESSENEKT